MKFRLWGTRGSIPSPLRTEEIEAKIQAALSAAGEKGVDLSDLTAIRAFLAGMPHAIRGTAGGDTSCLEVRSAGNLLIFDCGSGMRRLGLELMKEEFGRGQGVAHIFLCHTHWDHMMGWPFFNPSYVPGNRFYIYGVHPDLEERFRIQQTAPSMFPISLDYHAAEIQFVTLKEGSSIQIGQTQVKNMRFHHPGDSFGYRVEDNDGVFIYAGDSEYKTLDPQATQPYVDFFRDADALIFDAMFSLHDSYYFENWGHSSAVAGADLATRAGVRHLLLFHHAPTSTDREIWSLRDHAEEYLKQHPERPPCKIIVAYDGFEMEIWREAKLDTRLEQRPGGIAIFLSGRLVTETTPIALDAVNKAATKAGDPPMPIVVDLAEVIQVDHEGLKALLSARRNRRPLALSGLTSEVERTFSKAGAAEHFAIFDTPHDALEMMNRKSDLRLGRILNDRYQIEHQVGRGPLGDLYRAIDQTSNNQVTVQVVCPSLGAAPTQALVEAARAVAHLRHRAIVSTLDVDQQGPLTYLILEYKPGRSLRELLCDGSKTKPLPPMQAVCIALQIAQILEYVHDRNIAHGALKPEHVLISKDRTIVSHFGIGQPDIERPLSELPAYMGPLDYLAPEQIQGHGTSLAADLYALGTILYEMLTGAPPFAATESDEDLISLQLRQPPVPLRRRNPNVSYSLEHIVLSLLQKSPHKRPADAGAVRQVLTNLTNPKDTLTHARTLGLTDSAKDGRGCDVLPQPYLDPSLGRKKLQTKLRGHLDRVAQGNSGLLVLHGQGGIGKSQFILSVASQWATDPSLRVLYSKLFVNEGTAPYQLFVKILRRSFLDMPAHQLSQLLRDLAELAQPLLTLLPELKSAWSGSIPSQAKCERLEEAICQVFQQLTAKGPLVLILDDLQWIDGDSLRLLKQLVQQQIPSLLIMTFYRTEAIKPTHPLHQTLDDMEPWIDERLQVTPLGPIDVHQMVSTFQRSQLPPDFGLWIYGVTDGNALHIEQLVQAYLEGSGETRQPQDRTTTTTLEDVILWRLERLPEGILATLRQAAVLGHVFHANALCAALDQPVSEVVAELDKALQARLILGHPSEDRYSFSHPLIREVIYSEMMAGTRRRYHRRAAHAMGPAEQLDPMDEKLDLLAHHLVRAGQQDEALVLLAKATRRARKLCAYDAALNYIDQALELVEQLIQIASTEHEQEQRSNQRDSLLTARDKLKAVAVP